MLEKELELCLHLGFERAAALRHPFMTIEHLLLAILDNKMIQKALGIASIDIERLKQALSEYTEKLNRLTSKKESVKKITAKVKPTVEFQRTLQHACFLAQATGHREVNGIHILMAILVDPISYAARLLQTHSVTRLALMQFLLQGHMKDTPPAPSSHGPKRSPKSQSTLHIEVENSQNALAYALIDLTARARKGELEPLIGRSQELKCVLQTLCRRKKNNPLLIGEAGVGKTAIVEGLAHTLMQKNSPLSLRGAVIYSLDIAALLSGTKYRGDFEKRFNDLIAQLQLSKHAILFIDEVHLIIGAGSSSGGHIDIANLLKPALACGQLRVIGATTHHEYQTILEKDKALVRRFQRVPVGEPSPEEAFKILKGIRPQYEAYHKVRYSDEVVRAAIQLSSRYVTDRVLPDKAIDLLDELGSAVQLQGKRVHRFEVKLQDFNRILGQCRYTETGTSEPIECIKDFKTHLKQQIFGQDQALDEIVNILKLSKSGLHDPAAPIGALLLAGPTGVGKTELASVTAKLMQVPLLRFDMSEYNEKHTISRLLGAPPGYIGHDRGGLLSEAVLKQPHAVLLLDEIDKAHPNLMNILLQIMETGCLTDALGRRVIFYNILLMMTGNFGEAIWNRGVTGFQGIDRSQGALKEIHRHLSAEFRNRLDAILIFDRLTRDSLDRILSRTLDQIGQRLKVQQVSLKLSERARTAILNASLREREGARFLMRLVQKQIKYPVADLLLTEGVQKGGILWVDQEADLNHCTLQIFQRSRQQHQRLRTLKSSAQCPIV